MLDFTLPMHAAEFGESRPGVPIGLCTNEEVRVVNVRLYFTTDQASTLEPIEELSRVVLLKDAITSVGEHVPPGSTGTVVSVYGAGEAYCVEIAAPSPVLVTVPCGDLEPIAGEARRDLVAKTAQASG